MAAAQVLVEGSSVALEEVAGLALLEARQRDHLLVEGHSIALEGMESLALLET